MKPQRRIGFDGSINNKPKQTQKPTKATKVFDIYVTALPLLDSYESATKQYLETCLIEIERFIYSTQKERKKERKISRYPNTNGLSYCSLFFV